MKRTLPDSSLPSNLSPFELLFGRPPRTSLDTLVPVADVSDNTRGLDNFVEHRRQNMLENGDDDEMQLVLPAGGEVASLSSTEGSTVPGSRVLIPGGLPSSCFTDREVQLEFNGLTERDAES